MITVQIQLECFAVTLLLKSVLQYCIIELRHLLYLHLRVFSTARSFIHSYLFYRLSLRNGHTPLEVGRGKRHYFAEPRARWMVGTWSATGWGEVVTVQTLGVVYAFTADVFP